MSTTLERRTDNAPATMTLAELRAAEGVIERGKQVFVQVGQALMDIRKRKGYHLAGHATFEDYVKERWGWTRQRAYQLAVGINGEEDAQKVKAAFKKREELYAA